MIPFLATSHISWDKLKKKEVIFTNVKYFKIMCYDLPRTNIDSLHAFDI